MFYMGRARQVETTAFTGARVHVKSLDRRICNSGGDFNAELGRRNWTLTGYVGEYIRGIHSQTLSGSSSVSGYNDMFCNKLNFIWLRPRRLHHGRLRRLVPPEVHVFNQKMGITRWRYVLNWKKLVEGGRTFAVTRLKLKAIREYYSWAGCLKYGWKTSARHTRARTVEWSES
jgi:hypothetical protein